MFETYGFFKSSTYMHLSQEVGLAQSANTLCNVRYTGLFFVFLLRSNLFLGSSITTMSLFFTQRFEFQMSWNTYFATTRFLKARKMRVFLERLAELSLLTRYSMYCERVRVQAFLFNFLPSSRGPIYFWAVWLQQWVWSAHNSFTSVNLFYVIFF